MTLLARTKHCILGLPKIWARNRHTVCGTTELISEEFSPHLLKRMLDRRFNEVDLRRMLEHAAAYKPDVVEGRWVIDARHGKKDWEVIVEPDHAQRLLVVVTAYPVEKIK